MTERRFYFRIASAQVVECVSAHSFSAAKAKAFDTWIQWWDELEWLNPETVTDPNIHA